MDEHKKTYKKRFCTILFSILTLFLIFYITMVIFFVKTNISYTYSYALQPGSELIEKTDEQLDIEANSSLTSPVRTNALIVGVDKSEGLTDTIMIVSFVSTTGEINILSIPRDTYVTFSGESLANFRSVNKAVPSFMKINAINSYGGKSGIELLQAKLEEMLGIRIDYYVKVNLDAFKSIVDTIGGVYFEVPAGGLKYSDPTQNLYINLKEGYQLLNGSDAEGLVRFRKGYSSQDLQRVKVQQEFLKAFITQVLNKETLLKNIGGLVINFIKYIETDFGLLDIPKYLNAISKIDTENINTETLPGVPQTINGASYYIVNQAETKELVDKFFYGSTTLNNTEKEESTEDTEDTEDIE